MHYNNLSGRIYVEKTPEQCILSTTTVHKEPEKILDETDTRVKI